MVFVYIMLSWPVRRGKEYILAKKTFTYIAGPCVIEDEGLTLEIAGELKEITSHFPVRFVFKASYDKANRTSIESYRGPGFEKGMLILKKVKDSIGVEILSDVHSTSDVEAAADVLDIIQIPAFLCRQTDMLLAAGNSKRTVNIKKGQFVSPDDVKYIIEKVESTGNNDIMLTERGTCFGYNNLVVDFRSFSMMAGYGYPVIFDATHSVQIPSTGGRSSGKSEFIEPLARAAAAYGIDGLFCEVHPDPERALCDGANSLRLDKVEQLLETICAVRDAVEKSTQE